MHRILLTLAFVACLGITTSAQVKKIVPSGAAQGDGSSSTPYFSGYGAGRAQQVVDGAALCRVSALVREIALREDGRPPLRAKQGRTFSSLKVTLGYSGNAPDTMSTTFAANRMGTQTVIFQGRYSLPPQDTTSRPFNIVWKLSQAFLYLRSQGNLLVEFEVPGQPAKGDYFFDAHAQTGSGAVCSSFGQAGTFKTPETYQVSCLNPSALVPGGQIGIIAASFSKQYPAAFALGLSNTQYGPLKLPFDLAPVGAPGNFLNVSIDAIEIPTWSSGRGGWEARFTGPLPNHFLLWGLTVYTQGLFADQASNAMGLVFSKGLAMKIAGAGPAQLVGHYDSTQATGYRSPNVGMVMQFTGVFN